MKKVLLGLAVVSSMAMAGKVTNGLAEPNDRKMKVIEYRIIDK